MSTDFNEDLIIRQLSQLSENETKTILELLNTLNNSEQNLTDYIRDHLGDQHLEYSTLLPLSFIYGLFLLLGVLGNLATCLVIMTNEYMRTTTNIYLFNLAVADLATLMFAMPVELYLMWRQYPWTLGEVACDVKVVINETLIYTSILTIVAFTIERYQAICHPLTLNSRTSVGRAKKVILLIWCTSLVSAYPWSIFAKVNYIQYEGRDLEESAWCSMPFHQPDQHTSLYFTIASTVLYFLVPFTIVFVLYLRSYNQGRRTVIRMLVVVVVAFFICWLPFHSQRLMFVVVTLYGEWTLPLQQAQHVLFMVSGVFYYFNSILNPILYTIMSKRFRRGFNDISGTCKLFKGMRNSEDSSNKLQEFNMVNVPKKEPRCFKKRGEAEPVISTGLVLRQTGGEAKMTSLSECGGLGLGRTSTTQICLTHSLVITDKSNSEPAGGKYSHTHHAGRTPLNPVSLSCPH